MSNNMMSNNMMSNNMMSNNVIEDSDLIFHNDLNEDGYHSGILKLKMAKVPITNKPCFLYFSVDTSGSMEETHRGKSKLSFVKATLKNMIQFLENQEAEIYVEIRTFNSVVDVLQECVRITSENMADIVNKINRMVADSDTDIGNAMKVANEAIASYKDANPEHSIGHIFMSDGSPTSGLIRLDQLCPLVQEEFNNTFIGFGLDHNAHLFHKFSEKNNVEYRFIDKFENTALVYGEIIHQFLYPALVDVRLSVESGEIYDWKTNTWQIELIEPVIISEAEKIYHIRTDYSASNVRVNIIQNSTGELIDFTTPIPQLISLEDDTVEDQCLEDLTKYLFRQQTMACLFDSKHALSGDAKKNLKEKMKALFRELRTYMRDHDMLEEPMLKMLCDDIFITYKTMNSAYGMMFAVARCSSQGRQQTYNTTIDNGNTGDDVIDEDCYEYCDDDSDADTVILNYRMPRNRRRRTLVAPIRSGRVGSVLTQEMNNSLDLEEDEDEDYELEQQENEIDFIDEDDLDNYVSTSSNTTCYSTPTVLDTMRQMSQI